MSLYLSIYELFGKILSSVIKIPHSAVPYFPFFSGLLLHSKKFSTYCYRLSLSKLI